MNLHSIKYQYLQLIRNIRRTIVEIENYLDGITNSLNTQRKQNNPLGGKHAWLNITIVSKY